jgi:DNA-3-methyladenine glycosylase II
MILPVREPYDWERMLEWLGTRAIPGLEEVAGGVYRRAGEAEVRRVEGALELNGTADPAVIARLFDTGHDPAVLGDDPLFARAPGLRVPGAWSGWELAVRAVLGQQVSVAGARRTAAKLVDQLGDGRSFPTPKAVAEGVLPGMPQTRERALRALARAVSDGLRLDPPLDIPATRAALLQLPGFGPWTVEYIAMRALRDPDAWPAGDLWLKRAAGAGDAARWRPWRAYAAMVLWQTA